LLLAAVFVASLFWFVAIIAPSSAVTVGVQPGVVAVQWGPIMRGDAEPTRRHIRRIPDDWGVRPTWWPGYLSEPNVRSAWVPLWMPLALTSAATAFAWRRHLRPRPGLCPHCGYDLTGNSTGTCPECGTAASP
jgi:hypothetical protein